MTDGPAKEEEFYYYDPSPNTKKVYDPTLSKKGKKGNGAVYVSRPLLKLFPTRIDGKIGGVRQAMAVVGYDEGAGSQLAGAVLKFRVAKKSGVTAAWSQLRTAADAALVYDAQGVHVIELSGLKIRVIFTLYDDELTQWDYSPHDWEQRPRQPKLPGPGKHPVPSEELPCPLCDDHNYGANGRLCKRHWRQDYEAGLRTYEKLNLKPGTEPIDEHNTRPKTGRGIPADPTGDRASDRADTGEVDGLLRDELLTPSEAKVLGLFAAGWNHSEVAQEMGVSRGTVGKHRERAQKKLSPRRRRLTWREEMARSVPVVKVKRRQPPRSLLGQDSDVSLRRKDEVVCPRCYLIVRRGLMDGDRCNTCSETFSDSLSTNSQVVPLIEGQDHAPLFLERCV